MRGVPHTPRTRPEFSMTIGRAMKTRTITIRTGFLVILGLGILMPTLAPADDPKPKDGEKEKLRGNWVELSARDNGNEVVSHFKRRRAMIFKGSEDVVIEAVQGKKELQLTGTYR